MALMLRFGFAAQIIAAFVVFVLGYIGLFVSLLLVMLVVRGLYESVKWIRASVRKRATADRSPYPGGDDGERRILFLSAQLVSEDPHSELALHPVFHRQRAAGNYSLNHSGGSLR
jgi:hypothetical protein